jgi:hypothetical protein
LDKEQRQQLDDALLSRPGDADPETGLRPPAWWHGEEDAAASGAAFIGTMRR